MKILTDLVFSPKWMFVWLLLNGAIALGWAYGTLPEHFTKFCLYAAMLALAGRLWGFASGYKKQSELLEIVIDANRSLANTMMEMAKTIDPPRDDDTANREE